MTKERGKGASKGKESHLIVPDTATAISIMAVTSKRISIRVCMTSLTVSYPRPAAHTAPPAISEMPTMKSIVSARVSTQSLRMLRLNC